MIGGLLIIIIIIIIIRPAVAKDLAIDCTTILRF